MTKRGIWPVRAMYMLVAVALAISLIIIAAPAPTVVAATASNVTAEWERVTTPTIDDWLLAPESDIIDFAVADGGDVAYAIVYSDYDMDGDLSDEGYCLLKSEDGAATWDDITDDDWATYTLVKVATDGEDADFVVVALDIGGGIVRVYISDDGGSTFEDVTPDLTLTVYALEVSTEVDGKRDIAIGGTDGAAALWRSTATGDSATGWEDATDWTPTGDYPGWDDDGTLNSLAVVDIHFAPSWAADKTILVLTATNVTVHLQYGTWGLSPGWNADSIMGIAALTVAGPATDPPVTSVDHTMLGGVTAGINTPLDYSGRNSDGRYAWVNVNYYDTTGPVGKIFRIKNKSVMEVNQQIEGLPWLTNVSYVGYIAQGKAIAGVLGTGDPSVLTDCCWGVQVYRNDGVAQMDICCIFWEEACKPPTGVAAMAAFYVSADKAYAVALGGIPWYDEGAWSVSFDDGCNWNQLSLIDTRIDYLSDVAVSPDCNKTMLVSVNLIDMTGICCLDTEAPNPECTSCDSVWLYGEDLPEYGYSEYSEHWIRTWCGNLADDWGLLRLNPEETTGDTVYLVDYGTSTVYWSDLEGLDCWNRGSASVDSIMDLAVLDKETIFALGANGNVAMSDDFAIGWHEEVDSEVAPGYTIAVWGDHILVGSTDGEVSYSDDGGETFTELDEDVPNGYYVTVAFDTYFDTNGVIYAATAGGPDNGIYQWVIGESTLWMDLKAEPLEWQIGIDDGDMDHEEPVEVDFTGLVVDSPSNPFTDADNGGVIYASYYGYAYDDVLGWVWFTGVARSLEREVTVCTTCLTWDFLHEGLTPGSISEAEDFDAPPDALKICGCLTADTNSKLFALDDGWDYDMDEGLYGALWTFEDCYAKKAPETTSPENGAIVPADPCSCYSVPFTLTWDPLCDACYYEIQFALDEDFTMLVGVNGLTVSELEFQEIEGDVPTFSIMGGPAGGLSCEQTYYWRVRASKAATDQVIHSWWSDGYFSVAPSVEAGSITLVAPEPNAQGMPTKNVGFSWDLMAAADAFDWVLDDNFDFSSPVESKTGLGSTSYECTETLSYGTTYYWEVTAYKEGAAISTSAVGTFTTAATGEFCCPQCGLCFDTQAELQAHADEAHPAQPTTPFWVWIVIAIGAVLVIVVIVLIFRTRRV